QALKQGQSEWAVGVLMALFAVAPIVLAMQAGRMADRFGYHRPLHIAVVMSLAGSIVAALTSHYLAICLAAVLTGAGANFGRLVIPLLAHRLTESQVLMGAMLWTALVFAVYPLARSAWPMALCAVLLGLSLGAVQPMVMSTLHHITPHDRHGEAIAVRSMTINLSSTLMPLLFGVAGAAIGAASLFWVMGAAVGVGSYQARRMPATTAQPRESA